MRIITDPMRTKTGPMRIITDPMRSKTDPMPIITDPMRIWSDHYPLMALFENNDSLLGAIVQAQCVLLQTQCLL